MLKVTILYRHWFFSSSEYRSDSNFPHTMMYKTETWYMSKKMVTYLKVKTLLQSLLNKALFHVRSNLLCKTNLQVGKTVQLFYLCYFFTSTQSTRSFNIEVIVWCLPKISRNFLLKLKKKKLFSTQLIQFLTAYLVNVIYKNHRI